MNELDKMRPEVREAINRQDRQEKCDGYCPVCEDRAIIRAELLRLAMIETDALIALDCEHDWQAEHERAEKAEAELAAVKARTAGSPACNVFTDAKVYCCVPRDWVGKRVRLLVE